MDSIGKRLAVVRGEIPQAEFAKLFGVSRSTYANYEQGRNFPDANFLDRLNQKFGINLNWLVSGIGGMHVEKGASGLLNTVYNRGKNGKIKIIQGNNSAGGRAQVHLNEPEPTGYEISRLPGRPAPVDVDHIGAILGAIKSMDDHLAARGLKLKEDKRADIFLLLDQGIAPI